jgi:hypothetical protein
MKFAVHYWKDGRTGSVVIEADTPEAAKQAFRKKHPKVEITKTKLVRS